MSAIDAARAKVQALKLQREGAEVASIERERALRQIVGSLGRDDQALVARALATVPPDRRLDYLTAVLGLGGRALAPTVVGGAPVARLDLEQQVQWAGAPEEYGDEFDDILHHHAQAAIGEDGRPVNDLARNVRIRDRLDAQEAKAKANQGQLNPLTNTEGTLGNTVNVTSGGSAVQVVNWFGEEDKSSLVTVTIVPDLSNAGTGVKLNLPQFRPWADIRWGTRAIPAYARVDVGRGTQITLGGSFVAVDLGADTTSASATIRLSAWVSFMAAGRASPVTRTLFFDGLTQNVSSSDIQIPALAQSLLSVWCDANPVSNLTLVFRDFAGNVILNSIFNYSTNLVAPPTIGTSPLQFPNFVLPDDAYTVAVTSNNPGTVGARLVFGLNL